MRLMLLVWVLVSASVSSANDLTDAIENIEFRLDLQTINSINTNHVENCKYKFIERIDYWTACSAAEKLTGEGRNITLKFCADMIKDIKKQQAAECGE